MVAATRYRMNGGLPAAAQARDRDGAAAASSDYADLEFDVARGADGLRRIEDAWARIAARQARQRFVHWYGWMEAWLANLAESPNEVFFFVARKQGVPLAILPLVRERRWVAGLPLRVYALPQHPHLPLADIVSVDGLPMRALLAALKRRLVRDGGWDLLEFTPLLAESPLAAASDALPGIVQRTRRKRCDQLACTGDLDDIRARFSRNFRSNLNKARNKLAKKRDVRMTTLSLPPAVQPAFEDFLELEASGWKGGKGAGTAVALHPELVAFYQSLIDRTQGRAVINRLHADGRLIAAQFCVRDADTLYVLKLAYDESAKRLAPGNMLLERVIEAGIETGQWRYVNLVGDPPWFSDWAPEGQDVCTLRVFRPTPFGLAAAAAFNLRAKLLPIWRRIRG